MIQDVSHQENGFQTHQYVQVMKLNIKTVGVIFSILIKGKTDVYTEYMNVICRTVFVSELVKWQSEL